MDETITINNNDMKTSKAMRTAARILAMALFAVFPLSAVAQSAFVKAIEDFANGKKTNKMVTYFERPEQTDSCGSYALTYGFRIPGDGGRHLKRLCSAFAKDMGKAYYVERHSPRQGDPECRRSEVHNDSGTYCIVLGDGSFENRMVMAQMDDRVQGNRYVCELAWSSVGRNCGTEGTIKLLYGRKPAGEVLKASVAQAGKGDMEYWLQSADSIQQNAQDRERQLAGFIDHDIRPRNGYEVVKMFGYLKVAFQSSLQHMNTEKGGLVCMGLVNRMMDLLCTRENRNMLDYMQKGTIANGLDVLRRDCPDEYLCQQLKLMKVKIYQYGI